jgi:hypothetical protein
MRRLGVMEKTPHPSAAFPAGPSRKRWHPQPKSATISRARDHSKEPFFLRQASNSPYLCTKIPPFRRERRIHAQNREEPRASLHSLRKARLPYEHQMSENFALDPRPHREPLHRQPARTCPAVEEPDSESLESHSSPRRRDYPAAMLWEALLAALFARCTFQGIPRANRCISSG